MGLLIQSTAPNADSSTYGLITVQELMQHAPVISRRALPSNGSTGNGASRPSKSLHMQLCAGMMRLTALHVRHPSLCAHVRSTQSVLRTAPYQDTCTIYCASDDNEPRSPLRYWVFGVSTSYGASCRELFTKKHECPDSRCLNRLAGGPWWR